MRKALPPLQNLCGETRGIDTWFEIVSDHELRRVVQPWFERIMRACGPDVCEIMADGHPVACVGEAAFALR